MPNAQLVYEQLLTVFKEIALLQSCQTILGWDQRTYMPAKGVGLRSRQMALLAGMLHAKITAPDIGSRLNTLKASDLASGANPESAANIRELAYSYDKLVKLPREWVEEFTRIKAMAQTVWVEARKTNDFALFLPHLKTIIDFKRQYADMIGYDDDPYDALLDDFEPGATYKEIGQVFAAFRDELVALAAQIAASTVRPDGSILTRDYPVEVQEKFGKEAAAAIGFDFDGGRLDQTTHPFCSTLGPGDVRITTRFYPRFFPAAFFGIIHESGHGIYNQGLPEEHYGTPLGSSVSLGIHESQSRMWENMVGRNRTAWRHFFPRAKAYFPQALAGVSEDDFYFAINEVKPSLIRVEADEVTYNLHIILRFELEHALTVGQLKAEEVPSAWNEKFRALLGITPSTDTEGCLQDIHWSGGMIGYFPTYALGNLYAAQLFAQAGSEIPGLEAGFSEGNFAPLRQWLTEKIYRLGKRYRAAELVKVVTGKPLSHEPLIRYLRGKFGRLYRL